MNQLADAFIHNDFQGQFRYMYSKEQVKGLGILLQLFSYSVTLDLHSVLFLRIVLTPPTSPKVPGFSLHIKSHNRSRLHSDSISHCCQSVFNRACTKSTLPHSYPHYIPQARMYGSAIEEMIRCTL